MKISEKTLRKLLDKHNVTNEEVLQCFLNREGSFLIDNREDHTTNPPTPPIKLSSVSTIQRGKKDEIQKGN